MNYYYHKDAIHVSRVDLNVQNIDISLDFYLNSLGLSILSENENYVSLTADNTNEIIRLYEDKKMCCEKNMNIYHFALLLPSRKDLSKFLHHLILKQIPIDGAADHLVSEAIYLTDPDGIGIEICCDRDDSNWQISENKIIMDTLPFDYKGVYYESDENDIFINLPKETIIGHLHLQVKEINNVTNFYKDIIGFTVTFEELKNAVFLSDKLYHHHLALNNWSDELLDNAKSRLKSFVINYPSCEKYLKTCENIKTNNISYEESTEGVIIKDLENTKIYLKI